MFQAGTLTALISDKSMHMLTKLKKKKDAVTPKCTPQIIEEAKKIKRLYEKTIL